MLIFEHAFGNVNRVNLSTYRLVVARFPTDGIQPGPDGRITLYADLEHAVEQAGVTGGVVMEATLDAADVIRDPVDLALPHTTKPIPASRLTLVGS